MSMLFVTKATCAMYRFNLCFLYSSVSAFGDIEDLVIVHTYIRMMANVANK